MQRVFDVRMVFFVERDLCFGWMESLECQVWIPADAGDLRDQK